MAEIPNDLYTFTGPSRGELPILISVPHSGIFFPKDQAQLYQPKAITKPVDTDWFVDELYGFAPELGISTLIANYSRYVIDLNRDPAGAKLYQDKRQETQLIPTTTFTGDPLYKGELTSEIKKQRLTYFFEPYHAKIASELQRLKSKFKHVLLFDAHSIRRLVPTIQEEPFPDLILGNQDGKTCDPKLMQRAAAALSQGGAYQLSQNTPFKGGYITRSFGKPSTNVHALQLEMSQDIYMQEDSRKKIPNKWNALQDKLKSMLLALADELAKLP